MKALPKVHKQNIPIRLVINSINSHNYKVFIKIYYVDAKRKIHLKNRFTVKKTHLN